MSEREELADVFTGHPIGFGPKPAKLMRGHAQEIAELILAAGYGKRRMVATVEELDALPVGSVVMETEVAVRVEFGWRVSDLFGLYQSYEIDIPATVLYEPQS